MPFKVGIHCLRIGVISQLGDFVQRFLQVIFTKGCLPAAVKLKDIAQGKSFTDR
jgi:hypothetical protein